MAIVKANANILVDSENNKWLDLQSGILNTPFGHNSAVIRTALAEVMDLGLINTYDRAGMAQEELITLMSAYKSGYTWKPFNTGAEAIEKAIQVAATHFGRMPRIAVLRNSFHGKMLSMAWANLGDKLLDSWGNPLKLIRIDPEDSENPDFDVLIYEPIQGHDGTTQSEVRLRNLCDQRGALLIADEMITGFMRCGKRFMSETADIIVCGKGISAGIPLSMLGFKPNLLEDHKGTIPVGWRTTGAGNNLAMTVGSISLGMLMNSEASIKEIVNGIEARLRTIGFHATGAFGFKILKNQEATRSYFEDRRIIASWHNPPMIRVGPSFVTDVKDLERLEDALEGVDEL